MTWGSPTGGSNGAGTINAEAVYDDNSLLSCYVFDQVIDGTVDLNKWDLKVGDRLYIDKRDEQGRPVSYKKEVRSHTLARKFISRVGTEHDPLTLDGYAKHWKEKRHLSSLPNEVKFDVDEGMSTGEWIQRLVETVEIQAVLIEKINQRLKKTRKSITDDKE